MLSNARSRLGIHSCNQTHHALCMEWQYTFEVRVWDAGQQEDVDGDRLSTELAVL